MKKKKGESKRVQYNEDGSYAIQIKSGEEWKDARVGTLEDLKQGFIDVVKRGTTQTEGFQDESEKGFISKFGTTSGSMIFKGLGKPVTTETKTEDADAKLTDAEYFMKHKKARNK
jgi:hypothetical protein